jgi:hypothetical protein
VDRGERRRRRPALLRRDGRRRAAWCRVLPPHRPRDHGVDRDRAHLVRALGPAVAGDDGGRRTCWRGTRSTTSGYRRLRVEVPRRSTSRLAQRRGPVRVHRTRARSASTWSTRATTATPRGSRSARRRVARGSGQRSRRWLDPANFDERRPSAQRAERLLRVDERVERVQQVLNGGQRDLELDRRRRHRDGPVDRRPTSPQSLRHTPPTGWRPPGAATPASRRGRPPAPAAASPPRPRAATPPTAPTTARSGSSLAARGPRVRRSAGTPRARARGRAGARGGDVGARHAMVRR